MKSARLLSLLLLLQARQRMTTVELADRLEVSRRTILRDVEALSAAGVPVYAERGRHGGIVLLPGARLNVSHLDPAEREAVLVAGLDAAQRAQLDLAAVHETATRKIAARRSGDADPGAALADLIVVDNAAWLAPEGQGVSVAELALALRTRPRLRLRYRSSGASRAIARVVDPYGLATKAGRWYLVADQAGEPGLFALDRLEACEVLAEPARTRVGCDLRSVWADLRRRTEDPGSVVITARLRQTRLDLARRILGSRILGVDPVVAGWCTVRIGYPEMESVRQLLQFGDHIEVVAPPAARDRVHALATDLAARHRR
ncbi:helix-turn-helix transcriptional regulator [Raineyella sp. LH-20]|uniref:helix-turn-helix transcriptional regulator n=1 Tax=Raineyella sp. LH-20 TaxID=3081204 RepID=UPI002953FD5D|nr:WYL domain-containing protein [Raineyella sp. LH-20]WOP18247.1 WYL domain-containing protein [Raineyella sp. LH-20]